MYLYFLNWIKSFFQKKYISNKGYTFDSSTRNTIIWRNYTNADTKYGKETLDSIFK